MLHCPDAGLTLLRAEPEKPAPADETEPRRQEGETRGRILACARCLKPVTTEAARISVDGSHEHSFVNPAGIAYHIGCFSDAAGLVGVGEPSTYWSWFPPCSWQIELCGGCREHLGWLFRSPSTRFHGFILDRLVPLE